MFTQDYVLNGQGNGMVAERLQSVHFNPGMLRPYIASDGSHCVTINTGRTRRDDDKGSPTFNMTVPVYEAVRISDLRQQGFPEVPVWNSTSLRKEEWIKVDQKIIRASRKRLRAWSDLAAANSYGGFDGMGTMVLEQETMSDPGSAVVDMDGLAEGRNDSPRYNLEGLPLPITHSDFWLSKRRLAVSQNKGTPLNTTMAEAAGRRVAETVEKTLIGTITGVVGNPSPLTSGYNRTSAVYGYTNFPARQTYTSLTTPTGSNPEATVANFLTIIDLFAAQNFYGPFMVYTSTDWNRFLDNDYARLGGSNANMTLRDRLRKIDGIADIKRLDYLDATTNPFTLLFVQMTSEVAEAVNGLDLTTIQWDTHGGWKINFKVLCIYVPRLMADFNGNCGILQATVS